MSLAAPLDRVCTCGPWQIGQPEGHLDGCPRKALLAAPAAPLDRDALGRAMNRALPPLGDRESAPADYANLVAVYYAEEVNRG